MKMPKLVYVIPIGVTLAQLVKASVGQADVQRFEPHLGHNLLSCGVFLVSPGTNHNGPIGNDLIIVHLQLTYFRKYCVVLKLLIL